MIVAIDGPAGAGKSTVAKAVADRLGFVLVDTGAIYRGLALAAKEACVAWDDAEGLAALARQTSFRFEMHQGAPRLQIDGVDRADEIRTPEISKGASEVSAHPPVREALLALQRGLARASHVVMEGRDIGTVVFPDAGVKIFLTADDEVRAKRRARELQERGEPVDEAAVLQEIVARDQRDRSREVAPLRRAEDAIEVNSSALPLEEVVKAIETIVRARLASAGE